MVLWLQDVANHFFNIFRHSDRLKPNVRMFVLEYDKQLMSKTLADPVQTGKIECDFSETIQTAAKALGLRAGHRT